MSYDDPHNISGMAEILADDDEDINIEEIEKSIISGVSIKPKEVQVDMAKEYDADIHRLMNQFNGGSQPVISGNSSKLGQIGLTPDVKKKTTFALGNPLDDLDQDDQAVQASDSDSDSDDAQQQSPRKSSAAPWSASRPIDDQLHNMTNEEIKQSHINKVLSNMTGVEREEDANFLQQEEEEDEMARMLEHIDQLKTSLKNEGIDLSNIRDVTPNSSKKEIKALLKILQIKNDRLRYCDMFEEFILAGAYGLESAFDGKNTWFGTKIDLVGWPDMVKVKLKRMRYDTSSFVGDVMKDYNISHGWRILFELLPSLFLYSRDRRLRSNDNLVSDSKYRDAMLELSNV